MNNKRILTRPVLLTVGPLLIPSFGNMFVDGWNWPWTAFAFFSVVLFGAGLAYELVGKYAKAGVLGGFVVGEIVAVGVLAALRHMNPDDDVAGVVLIAFLLSGSLFAFAGFLIQCLLNRK